jgi:hypothetical protein
VRTVIVRPTIVLTTDRSPSRRRHPVTSTARRQDPFTESDEVAAAIERERLLLVRCVETAYESLRVMPGVDTSARTLVWFAGRLLLAHERATKRDRD